MVSGNEIAQTVTVNVDTQAPSVSLTTPSGGATVSGTVSLGASATDDVGVSRVDFYKDAMLLGSDNTTPYAMSWNTTSETIGLHTLSARSVDEAGNTGLSSPVIVTVGSTSTADTQAPQVIITTPADGSLVTGLVKVQASATDNVDVKRLELYIDGVLKASSSTRRVSINWNVRSSAVGTGAHTIMAKAIDAAGNVGSVTITVTK